MLSSLLIVAAASAGSAYIAAEQDGAPVSGARILIDGQETGLTAPATVAGLAPGSHRVTVLGPCQRGEGTVYIHAGARESTVARLTVPLVEGSASLTLRLDPPDSAAEIDSIPFPAAPGTPAMLACGEHVLKVTREGYIPLVIPVSLQMDERQVLPVKLEPLGIATLRIEASPRQAVVRLDGEQVGRGRVTLEDIYGGVHVVRADLDGYTSEEKVISLSDGEDRVVELALVPADGSAIAGDDARSQRLRVAGGATLVVAGVGSSAYALSEYLRLRPIHEDYREQIEQGELAGAAADEYYDSRIQPGNTRMYIAEIAGALLLGSGLVVLF